ncbi:hypothetical protein LCGC14_1505740 [marine sediment metagenome]|uniref:Uncharacterized protein n=1 Tax=marine sediment metagenome TaxID=412755 RepID=A0A0F9JNJ0_9ZZZZ
MTNLLEKSLLIGFGILVLTIFSSIITPFLAKIVEFNENEKNDLESYMIFINEIDLAIIYVIQNPNELYLKKIEYPSNLNISFYDHFAEYEFIIDKKIYNKIFIYNKTFINSYFRGIPPQTYLLNASYHSSFIGINLIKLY